MCVVWKRGECKCAQGHVSVGKGHALPCQVGSGSKAVYKGDKVERPKCVVGIKVCGKVYGASNRQAVKGGEAKEGKGGGGVCVCVRV